MTYYHNGSPIGDSLISAQAYAYAKVRDDYSAIVVVKDESGGLVIEAEARKAYGVTVPYYRRWRGESFTGWVKFSQRVQRCVA